METGTENVMPYIEKQKSILPHIKPKFFIKTKGFRGVFFDMWDSDVPNNYRPS